MRPIQRSEIMSLKLYEAARSELRPEILEAKKLRRIHVGDYLTFLFENRTTVRYQIQEMIRVEKLTKEEEIQHEIDTYNELLGSDAGLGCTLLIEIDDPEERSKLLTKWLDLPKHLYVRFEDGSKGRAQYDARQIGETRVSSVQYLHFPSDGKAPVAVGVDHPDYTAETTLTDASRAALAKDLAEEEDLVVPEAKVLAATPVATRASATKGFQFDKASLLKRARAHALDAPGVGGSSQIVDEVLPALETILATAVVGSLAAKTRSFLAQAAGDVRLAETLDEIAEARFEIADLVASRVLQLGGSPSFDPGTSSERSLVPGAKDAALAVVAGEELVSVRVTIEALRELIDWIQGRDPTTRGLLEDILASEEAQAEELARCLRRIG